MKSLGEALPEEQARVRKILEEAIGLGSPGFFLSAVCRNALSEAEKAAASGDLVAMIRAYEELKEIKD